MFVLVGVVALTPLLLAQTPMPTPGQTPQPPTSPTQNAPGSASMKGAAPAQNGAQSGGESKSASPGEEKQSASGKGGHLSPIAPAQPPELTAHPRIGLALGGGGALGLAHIGVLKWMEENHIPVDMIAGTSMGCLVSSLYATGRTPDELSHVVNDRVFTSVFSFSNSYSSRSFRRRQESRELPNAVTIGLKHGISFRNAVLVDQGLNAFLDREFLRYDDQTDFNTLPIPLRCISTDLNAVKPVVFARGSIPDAVRASVAIPGIFPPYEMNGHEFVDGEVLENLPTPALKEMQPDVMIASSLPLAPVAKGQLGSILGVYGRAFSVAVEAAEARDRKLADVLIMPDIKGLTVTDYFKSAELEQRGYDAAKAQKDKLLKYALSDADWAAYIAHRKSLIRGPAAPVLRVRVTGPDPTATKAVQLLFAPLVNQPVDTAKIEALLDQVRADGAFEADYTVGYETAQQYAEQRTGAAPLPPGTVPVPTTTTAPDDSSKPGATPVQRPGAPNPKPGTAPTSNQPGVPKTGGDQTGGDQTGADQAGGNQAGGALADRPGAAGLAATQEATPQSLADIAARPIILVDVKRRKTGPPFLLVGANVESQTNAFTRATVEGIILDQDFGGYGSELRSTVTLGYLTQLGTEYFRPFNALAPPERTFFVAPRADFLREPFPIFSNQLQIADRQLQHFDVGGDVGWTNLRTQELRAGYDFQQLHWVTTIGSDGLPGFSGQAQKARVKYDYDTQDRALVPQFGTHLTTEAGYLFSAVESPNAPQLLGKVSYAHRFSLHKAPPPDRPLDPNRGHEVFFMAAEGGTMFDRNVAQPFRFTLGGPLRLSASAIDQYRGTDYWLAEPAILRRIAQLPQPLGQSIYLGLGLEAGQMYAPGTPTITREDAYFGIVAETPLGVITLAPAIGSNGERKLVFTLGKLF
jgi:NTE family protein